tara:strand:+ start:6134 stop:6412 length:279 start_codon:yes stop_codon:yes gene_type:complete
MYSSNSPYSKTPIKGDYLDIMNPKFIIRDESDESYVIESKYEMRPDLLSHKLFGSVKYWWVFAVRNPDKIVDPIQDFKAGCTIRIPKLENIR